VPRLVCTMGLPDGVRAEIPPPAEKRVAIAGKFLDEVRIAQGGNTLLSFPVDRHRGVIDDDGAATVYAMMPSALQLFAEGSLPRVGGDPVEVFIGGRKLGPMVLTEVRCGGENYRHDIAFGPARILPAPSAATLPVDPASGAIFFSPRTSGEGALNRSPARRLAGLRLESASVRRVLREGDVRGVISGRDPENADGRDDGPAGPRSCSLKTRPGRERQRAVNVNRFGRVERGRLTAMQS
jgi:hypothetical protein